LSSERHFNISVEDQSSVVPESAFVKLHLLMLCGFFCHYSSDRSL